MNICAVRWLENICSGKPPTLTVHEPVMISAATLDAEQAKTGRYISQREIRLLGTPDLRYGNLWCRHCGNLYAAES